jgi:hypothetical protein
MTKQTIEQIKEKMRKLLEEVTHNDEEPQSIGNPDKIFEREDNEDENGEPVTTKQEQPGRNQNSKGKN